MELADRAPPPPDVHAERSSRGSRGRIAGRSGRTARGRSRAFSSPLRQRRIAHVSIRRSASSSTTRRKWFDDERRHGGQQRLERLDRARRRLGVVADRVADRLAHVGVEQVDGPHGEHPERAVRIARERRAGPRPAARTRADAAPSARPRRRRPSSAPRRRRGDRSAIPSRSTAWINDAGTPEAPARSSRVERRDPRRRRRRGRPRRRPPGLRRRPPARRSATRPIAASVRPLPCRSRIRRIRSACVVVVPGDASLALGLRQQAPRLVEANRVHRDVAGGRELFDPVPHDPPLYECALQPSHQQLARPTGTGRTDTMRRVRHARRASASCVVLACVVGTMAVGTAPQVARARAGTTATAGSTGCLCYTDIVPLLGDRAARRRAAAVLRRVRKPRENNCDEYPVLTMYLMRAAAWISGNDYRGLLLHERGPPARVRRGSPSWCLWLLAGRRALWFALAPTLLIYGTINWDLAAVACATRRARRVVARRRDGWAGVLLGLGAATKFYPALLLVPLFLQGLQDREPDRSIRLLWWSAGTWVAVNLPFAVARRPGDPALPVGWSTFFSFNGGAHTRLRQRLVHRVPPRGRRLHLDRQREPVRADAVPRARRSSRSSWKARRDPSFPRWTIGVPLLICFLLTNKVYSPQYSLWLLPWFALDDADACAGSSRSRSPTSRCSSPGSGSSGPTPAR